MEENRSIVVLSLFDGMSCGQTALKELGIIPEIYYASEIDKHAIGETQLNFPNTIQLGSVVDVDVSKLHRIDLLIGGSPCQSFSFAGKRKGMAALQKPTFKKPSIKEWKKYISDQENVLYDYEDFVNFMEEQHELKTDESFMEHVEIYTLEKYLELKEQDFEFEGQSYLFWEYMRILTDIRKYNPDVKFLLENVEMGNKWERVLSEAIGIYGVHINSALVSAQNRKRIYWTDIRTKQVGLFGELHADIPQPKDEGILLRDVLERDVAEKYYLSSKMMNWLDKHDKKSKENGNGFKLNLKNGDDKGGCISSGAFKQNLSADYVCVAMRGRNPDNPSDRTVGSQTEQRLEPNLSGKTNCLMSVQKDNLVLQINPSKESGGVQPYQQNRVYDPNGISPCLNTDSRPHAIVEINERQQRNLKDVNEKADTFLSPSWKGSQANGITLVHENIICHNTMPRSSKTGKGGTGPLSRNDGKTYCLDTGQTNAIEIQQSRIRRLTPTEVARLQTVPDWYIWDCSDTQIYRMCGNGWTIKVIMHIFHF